MGERCRAVAVVLVAAGAIGLTGAGLSSAGQPGSWGTSPPVAPAVRRPPVAATYVGMILTTVPPGVTEVAGMVVSDRSGALTDYAVSLMRDGRGGMLWLSRLSYPGGADIPTSQVLDVVRLPRLRSGESVTLADCVDAIGQPLPDSAAIFDETFGVGPARVVWRADPATAAFVPLAPSGLSCGYADEGV
ncbi:MAG: hypothetical protein ACREMG_00205 [Gemmatimonadales bacterium]